MDPFDDQPMEAFFNFVGAQLEEHENVLANLGSTSSADPLPASSSAAEVASDMAGIQLEDNGKVPDLNSTSSTDPLPATSSAAEVANDVAGIQLEDNGKVPDLNSTSSVTNPPSASSSVLENDIARSYFGAQYNVGIQGRRARQQIWARAPSTKAVFKSPDADLPAYPTNSFTSAEEAQDSQPSAGSECLHRYLWIGMSGRWGLEYNTSKAGKDKSIDSVRDSLRVVTPITKAKQLKLYALMGISKFKTPCIINNDLCFYFDEFSKESRTKGKREKSRVWNKAILDHVNQICTIPTTQEDSDGFENFDAVDLQLSYEISLSNRINNAINVHFLAPESGILQSLIDFLEHEFPALQDPPPPRSLLIFFDFDFSLELLELPATEYDAYGPFLQDSSDKLQDLSLEDKEPGAYHLACLVQRALRVKYDIVLPVVELMQIRAALKKSGSFLPFLLIRAFFVHARTLLKRSSRIDVDECFTDVTEIAGNAPPALSNRTTVSQPSKSAWMNLNRSILDILKQLVDAEKESIVQLDAEFGSVVPAGTFEQVWRKFSQQSDVDSCRLMIKELVRMLHYHGQQRSSASLKVLTDLISQMDTVHL